MQSQCSDEREAEGALVTGQEKARDGRSRDGSDVAASQAANLRAWKRPGPDSTLEVAGPAQPC